MNELVDQIANDFINGNISDVKKALAELKGTEAAFVGVSVYNALPLGQPAAFLKLLQTWAE